jgi:hypothetical protein
VVDPSVNSSVDTVRTSSTAIETLFVTFGTPNFSQARSRYLRSLARYGYTRVLAFDTKSPIIAKARDENPKIFAATRGYGYWIWKPYIIEAALEQSSPGARIVYTDIAVELVGSPERLFEVTRNHDICAFRIGSGMPQRISTKRDAFVLMGADYSEFWDDEMVNGGFLLLRNSSIARRFLEEWRVAMRDRRLVMDYPSALGLPELPDFRAHRHDQSILSILAHKYATPIFPDPSQWGRDRNGHAQMRPGSPRFVPADFGRVFNHHRKGDRPLYRRIASNAKAALTGKLNLASALRGLASKP